MAQVFRPAANTIALLVIASLGAAPILLAGLGYSLMRSPYVTNQSVTREQPVPFSHAHHVGGLGLDCRYCHTSVTTARFAGIPPTETCMTCHSQLWTNAAMLAPVRESLAANTADSLAAGPCPPRLRLFRSQHSYREGHRLFDLSRRSRPDASDAASGAADDGLVPRLPSPSRSRDPSPRQSL